MRGYHVVCRYKIDGREEFHLASFFFSDPERAAWERDQLQLREERKRSWTGRNSRVKDFRFVVEVSTVEQCHGDQMTREMALECWERMDRDLDLSKFSVSNA